MAATQYTRRFTIFTDSGSGNAINALTDYRAGLGSWPALIIELNSGGYLVNGSLINQATVTYATEANDTNIVGIFASIAEDYGDVAIVTESYIVSLGF